MSQNNINGLATRPVGRLLWEYSLPAVVGMIVVSIYNVADRIILGQYVGPEAIAGLAITFPVMNLATAFGVLVGGGASARVSILLGQKRNTDAEYVLGNALVLTLIIGTLYVGAFAVFLDDILRAFGADAHTLPPAHDFMTVLLPGMILTNLTFGFNNIQRASGYPRRAMMAMILSAVINIALATLFVCVFGWGIRGAAAATVTAMLCAAVFVLWHFTRRTSTVRFRRGIYRLRPKVIASIVSIGAAPSLVNMAGCLVNVLINRSLMTHSGGDTVSAIAAAGIFSTYTQLFVMVIIGICQGMQPIVGYNFGAGQLHRLSRAYWLAVAVSTGLAVAATAGAQLIPDYIARAFGSDPHLLATTVRCLNISLLGFSVVGFQIVSTTFFQSIGAAVKAILLGLTRQVLFIIPLLVVLPRLYGLDGVWMSFPISDVLATAVTAVLILHEFRRLHRPAAHN